MNITFTPVRFGGLNTSKFSTKIVVYIGHYWLTAQCLSFRRVQQNLLVDQSYFPALAGLIRRVVYYENTKLKQF